MSILVDESTRILVLGITGREAVSFTRDTLDYGGRVVAGVTPGRGGRDVHVQREENSAAAKASMLRSAGVHVADTLADIPSLVRG